MDAGVVNCAIFSTHLLRCSSLYIGMELLRSTFSRAVVEFIQYMVCQCARMGRGRIGSNWTVVRAVPIIAIDNIATVDIMGHGSTTRVLASSSPGDFSYPDGRRQRRPPRLRHHPGH